jgi:AraC-like DNA-binding protein
MNPDHQGPSGGSRSTAEEEEIAVVTSGRKSPFQKLLDGAGNMISRLHSTSSSKGHIDEGDDSETHKSGDDESDTEGQEEQDKEDEIELQAEQERQDNFEAELADFAKTAFEKQVNAKPMHSSFGRSFEQLQVGIVNKESNTYLSAWNMLTEEERITLISQNVGPPPSNEDLQELWTIFRETEVGEMISPFVGWWSEILHIKRVDERRIPSVKMFIDFFLEGLEITRIRWAKEVASHVTTTLAESSREWVSKQNELMKQRIKVLEKLSKEQTKKLQQQKQQQKPKPAIETKVTVVSAQTRSKASAKPKLPGGGYEETLHNTTNEPAPGSKSKLTSSEHDQVASLTREEIAKMILDGVKASKIDATNLDLSLRSRHFLKPPLSFYPTVTRSDLDNDRRIEQIRKSVAGAVKFDNVNGVEIEEVLRDYNEMAKNLKMSKEEFRGKFQQVFGKNPKELIGTLIDRNLSIEDIYHRIQLTYSNLPTPAKARKLLEEIGLDHEFASLGQAEEAILKLAKIAAHEVELENQPSTKARLANTTLIRILPRNFHALAEVERQKLFSEAGGLEPSFDEFLVCLRHMRDAIDQAWMERADKKKSKAAEKVVHKPIVKVSAIATSQPTVEPVKNELTGQPLFQMNKGQDNIPNYGQLYCKLCGKRDHDAPMCKIYRTDDERKVYDEKCHRCKLLFHNPTYCHEWRAIQYSLLQREKPDEQGENFSKGGNNKRWKNGRGGNRGNYRGNQNFDKDQKDPTDPTPSPPTPPKN